MNEASIMRNNERYERLAKAFFGATGLLAPGKSNPDGVLTQATFDEWGSWLDKYSEAVLNHPEIGAYDDRD